MTRYVLEGTWSGYTSSQSRVVHREIIKDKKRVARLLKLRVIVYTDNTSLYLHLRPAEPRERIREIRSYDSLIRQAEQLDKSRVTVLELP